MRKQDKPQNWGKFVEFLKDHLAEALSQHIQDEIEFLLNIYLDHEECPHRRTTVLTTGGYHYAAGEVWDDLKDHTVCLDCGMVIEDDQDAEDAEDEDADEEAVIF
jgi:pantothenate kinase